MVIREENSVDNLPLLELVLTAVVVMVGLSAACHMIESVMRWRLNKR